MTIFNKDGKVYVLRAPNPIVKSQVAWDPSKLVYHNFTWDEIKIKNESKVKKIKTNEAEEFKKTYEPNQETIKEPLAKDSVVKEPKEDIQKNKNKPEPDAQESNQENEPKRDFDLPYIKYKVLSYCLPAKVEKKNDKFYGETWFKVKYGKKIIFPSIIINTTDFDFEFWTSDPREQITEKSIIYPFSYEVHNKETDSYDRVPFDEYRWWKVVEKEKKEGGWLFKCVPSESQPDFSD